MLFIQVLLELCIIVRGYFVQKGGGNNIIEAIQLLNMNILYRSNIIIKFSDYNFVHSLLGFDFILGSSSYLRHFTLITTRIGSPEERRDMTPFQTAPLLGSNLCCLSGNLSNKIRTI